MTGDVMTHSAQVLPLSGATAEALELSDDFTLPGNGVSWFIKNLDSSNNVLIGEAGDDAADMVMIKPGESAIFSSIGQLYAKSSSASNTVSVEYIGIEL